MSIAGPAQTWLRQATALVPVVASVAVADWGLKAAAQVAGLHIAYHERELSWYPWYVVLASTVVVGALIACAGPRISTTLRLAVGLTLGGALGNIAELAAFGRVTDFIPLPPASLASPGDLCLFASGAIVCFEAARGFSGALRRRATLAHRAP
jgi:hypothetical protein